MIYQVDNLISFKGHAGAVYDLDYAYKSSLIASVSGDGCLMHWDIGKLEGYNSRIQLPAVAYCFHYLSQINSYSIGLSSGNIIQVDMTERKEVRSIKLGDSPVFCIRFISSLNLILAGSGDGKLFFIEVDTLNLIHELSLGNSKIRAAEMDEYRDRIYVACGDGNCFVINGKMTHLRNYNLFFKFWRIVGGVSTIF